MRARPRRARPCWRPRAPEPARLSRPRLWAARRARPCTRPDAATTEGSPAWPGAARRPAAASARRSSWGRRRPRRRRLLLRLRRRRRARPRPQATASGADALVGCCGASRTRRSTPGPLRGRRRNGCNALRDSCLRRWLGLGLGLAAILGDAEVLPAARAKAGERRDLATALTAAKRRAVRGGAQHLVELDEAAVELDEL